MYLYGVVDVGIHKFTFKNYLKQGPLYIVQIIKLVATYSLIIVTQLYSCFYVVNECGQYVHLSDNLIFCDCFVGMYDTAYLGVACMHYAS